MEYVNTRELEENVKTRELGRKGIEKERKETDEVHEKLDNNDDLRQIVRKLNTKNNHLRMGVEK